MLEFKYRFPLQWGTIRRKIYEEFYERVSWFYQSWKCLRYGSWYYHCGAFTAIVSSLTSDIISPILGLFGGLNFDKYAFTFGEVTIGYGKFITAVINFLIMAFVVFLVIRQLNKLYKKPAPSAAPTEKECPYCKTKIAIAATRCPHCTSILSDEIQKEAAAAVKEI